MRAYGAELLLHHRTKAAWNTRAILRSKCRARGEGVVLDQFANTDNPRVHYETTGPEVWRDTDGRITHFVSAMGTTGTIMGVSRYLKEKNPAIQIIGAQPAEGSQIPGIRKWPEKYLPKIYDPSRVDRIESVTQTPKPRRGNWPKRASSVVSLRRRLVRSHSVLRPKLRARRSSLLCGSRRSLFIDGRFPG